MPVTDFVPKKFICPFMQSVAVEVLRDPTTGKVSKVVIHEKDFYVSELYCRSFAFGKGCMYYDEKKRVCKLGWDEKRLKERIEELEKRFGELGIYVEKV